MWAVDGQQTIDRSVVCAMPSKLTLSLTPARAVDRYWLQGIESIRRAGVDGILQYSERPDVRILPLVCAVVCLQRIQRTGVVCLEQQCSTYQRQMRIFVGRHHGTVIGVLWAATGNEASYQYQQGQRNSIAFTRKLDSGGTKRAPTVSMLRIWYR